jgi:hypothetical protein
VRWTRKFCRIVRTFDNGTLVPYIVDRRKILLAVQLCHPSIAIALAIWATLFRAERKLPGEFLDFVDQKGGVGPIRAPWALEWACMLSPRRGVGGQAGRLSVVRNFLTYLQAFIAETEVPHHGLLRGPDPRKPYLFSVDESAACWQPRWNSARETHYVHTPENE